MRTAVPGNSRRTAYWLIAVLAVLIGVHMAYRNQPVALPSVGVPALHVTLRGQATKVGPSEITVNLEDPHGNLTGIIRTVALTPSTRILWPGPSPKQGSSGLTALRPGYHVVIRAQGGSDNSLIAQVVLVSYPPVTGTLGSVQNGQLSIHVPGQSSPVLVTVNSHTAYFVPNGQWQLLASGATIRVMVHPGPNGSLVASMVLVSPPSGGS